MGMEKNIVFVLNNISDYQQLIGDIASSELYVLDSNADVLSQMATILASYSDLDAIHLFTHGTVGELDLGSLRLSEANLNDYADTLGQIGASLSESGDILFYGCNVAQSGADFIGRLAQATGADIAASSDATGSITLGGDWTLEAHSGNIDAAAMAATAFDGVLAPSGSPMYDFEGPTTDSGTEVTFDNGTGHTLSASCPNSLDIWTMDGNSYLVAQPNTGTIRLHFTDNATFDATSVKINSLMYGMVNTDLMITSNLTDRDALNYSSSNANNDELYVWNGDFTGGFDTIDLSMFQGVTDLYIEGWSGSSIAIGIDDFTVDFPVSNTAPTNTISASYTTNEDTVKHITDLAVADTDGDTVTVTLSVDSGVINLPNINTAANITAIDTNGLDESISFSGGVDDINLMLDGGIDFYPDANANGNGYATVTMTTSDGNGGSDTDTATIDVTAVNDVPTFDIRNGHFSTSFTGWDTDGAYNSDEYASCNASALLPDGSIINVGDATFQGTPYVALTKLNSDGTPNADFGNSGFKVFNGGTVFGIGGSATSVAVEPDGKIVMSGSNGEGYIFLAILNSDGSSDSIINVSDDLENNNGIDIGSLYLDYIALQADGKIVLAGGQNPAQDSGFNADGGDVVLARYNADGTVDTSFGTEGTVVTDLGNADGCSGMTIDASGAIFVAVSGGNNSDMGIVKYTSGGLLDTDFGTSGIAWTTIENNAEAGAIKIDANGKIVLAGSFDGTDGNSDIALARFNANGTLDTNFSADGTTVFNTDDIMDGDGGDDYAGSLAIDANGAIYVGGEFGFYGENADGYTGNASFESVVKFDSAGTLDTTFAQGGMIIPAYVDDGYVIVDTQAQDAYVDDYWYSDNDPHGDSGTVSSILIQSDGKIVLGGTYSSIDYDYDFYDYSGMSISRIDTNGNYDTHNFGSMADTVADSDTDDFTEGGDPVTIGGSNWSYYTPSVYDVEQHAADNYAGGTLTIHRAGGANSEDILFFDILNQTSPFVLNGITYGTNGNGTPVLYDINHNVFATYDVSTPGQLVVHFTSEATASTQTLVDAVTASILYVNTNTLNPAYDAGEVELSWLYNDGDEQETTSSCFIGIEGEDDGGIEGTVNVSGAPTTGTTLTVTGLDSVTDPDLVTDENPEGMVPEDGLSFQWQVSSDGGETWENINGAYDSTFEVTETENGKEIRVVVGYEDVTNGLYTEVESDSASSASSGGSSDSGGNSGGGTSTIIDDDNLSEVVKTTPVTETVGNTTVTTQTATATRTYTDDDGHTITQTNKTVQAVEITAPTNGSSTTTAVPLYWGESTQTEWATTASVSSGVTLASEGNRAPVTTQTTATAIDDLIYYIQTTVPSSDSTKTEMLNGGSSFLSELANVATLVVNKVVLSTTSTTAPATVILDGMATAITTNGVTDTPKEALVIDGSSLSSGSTVSLSNIEFGVLTGANLNVVMTGSATQTVFTGSGTQTLTTSSLTQNQLYAGSGNDLFHITGMIESALSAPRAEAVNSLSTADTFADSIVNKTALHGEEGDDTASTEGAGTQNVFVHGGSGEDSISYQDSINDYTITKDEGITYIRANGSATTDILLNVESIQFDDQTYTVENEVQLTKIATLYQQVLGRQAEVDGFQYWAHDYANGESIGNIATNFVRSSEYFSNTGNAWDTMSNSQRIEVFYELMLGRASDETGKNFWLNALDNGMNIQQVAECFVDSIEMQGVYLSEQGWSFTVA